MFFNKEILQGIYCNDVYKKLFKMMCSGQIMFLA